MITSLDTAREKNKIQKATRIICAAIRDLIDHRQEGSIWSAEPLICSSLMLFIKKHASFIMVSPILAFFLLYSLFYRYCIMFLKIQYQYCTDIQNVRSGLTFCTNACAYCEHLAARRSNWSALFLAFVEYSWTITRIGSRADMYVYFSISCNILSWSSFILSICHRSLHIWRSLLKV